MVLAAQMLQVGDTIHMRTVNDQFDQAHSVGGQQWLVLTWDRATTFAANRYFDHNDSLLAADSAAMIVDVSTIPSGIYSLFVLPRMQAYEHPILLSADKPFNASLPYRPGYVTLLRLQKGKITSIDFVEDEEALAAYFKAAIMSRAPSAR